MATQTCPTSFVERFMIRSPAPRFGGVSEVRPRAGPTTARRTETVTSSSALSRITGRGGESSPATTSSAFLPKSQSVFYALSAIWLTTSETAQRISCPANSLATARTHRRRQATHSTTSSAAPPLPGNAAADRPTTGQCDIRTSRTNFFRQLECCGRRVWSDPTGKLGGTPTQTGRRPWRDGLHRRVQWLGRRSAHLLAQETPTTLPFAAASAARVHEAQRHLQRG